ncbi:MAG: radical SAM protein [Candidatus Bathyarchaeia archaeon]|nr:radical SAM protein [Candidatus Bathyarchaeota archaeon]
MESGPEKVRVSIGSAIVLGLVRGVVSAEPTTIYLLTYREGRCSANCAFCPQARESTARTDMLSRVIWPDFKLEDVLSCIKRAFGDGRIKRVCIQALNYPGVHRNVAYLASRIRSTADVPISVSCQPLNREDMTELYMVGVERVSIALDAATEDIFSRVKGELVGGPYRWSTHINALRIAVEVFGRGNVTTHLIVGLGESEEDLVATIQRCMDLGVFPALFAFTPIPGTKMADKSRPPIDYYRRAQLAHYLITRGIKRYEDMEFKGGRLVGFGLQRESLERIIMSGEPFLTSGCPGCNRPYYNEDPRGPIYNYPRKPTPNELMEIMRQIGIPALKQ